MRLKVFKNNFAENLESMIDELAEAWEIIDIKTHYKKPFWVAVVVYKER